jgi:hypothetical protein
MCIYILMYMKVCFQGLNRREKRKVDFTHVDEYQK